MLETTRSHAPAPGIPDAAAPLIPSTPPFTLLLRDRDGVRHRFGYDPHGSELTNPAGEPFVVGREHRAWPDVTRVSPDQPGRKVRAVKRLKIQLGLGCNYTCSYCLQADQIGQAVKSGTRDAEIFLGSLDTWLEGAPKRIEFWGGEPLIYWHKIALLLPALRQRYAAADILIITNGSLLTDEIIDAIERYDVSVAISHDGPGQPVRGPDPLDEPAAGALIRKLVARRMGTGKFSFNAVLTPASHDASAVIDWFQARFGDDVVVGFEGVVHDYGGDASAQFSPEQLRAFTQELALQIIDGRAMRSSAIVARVQGAITAMLEGRPSSALGQKCGMDHEGNLAVDLLGNIITCQNTGGNGEHRIGHVRSLDRAALTTSYHWSFREECPTCPVLQLCAGSCMYQTGDGWAHSCNAEFAFNMAIFAGAIFYLTGCVLERVDGPMIRPTLSRDAIAVAA